MGYSDDSGCLRLCLAPIISSACRHATDVRCLIMFDIRDYYTQIWHWEIVKMLVGPFYKKKGANIVILSSQTSSHIANMKMSTFSTLFVSDLCPLVEVVARTVTS